MMKKLLLSMLLITTLLVPSVFSFTVELVKTDPAPVVAGDYADITVRVTNNARGETKEDVSFGIDKTQFISPLTQSEQSIEQVFSEESLTRTFRVFFSEDLEQGYIEVPFFVKSLGLDETFDVPLYIEDSHRAPEFHVGEVSTTPQELIADSDDNKVSITLQNLGDKDAQLVKVELIPQSESIKASHSYSLQDSVASINAGSEAQVEFTLDIEEDVKESVPAKLKLHYRAEKAIGNTFETYEKELDFLLELTNSPQLIVENVELLDGFKIGTTENRVRVTVKNTGTKEAKEVRVRGVPDISYPFMFEETTQYVASEIGVGESAVVEFKTEVFTGAQIKDYQTTVILESLLGETRYSSEDTITITVQERAGSDNDGSTGIYLVSGVVLVSVGLGINTLRSRKKHK